MLEGMGLLFCYFLLRLIYELGMMWNLSTQQSNDIWPY